MTADLAGKELGMMTHSLIPEGLTTTTQEVRAIAKLAMVSERTVWRVPSACGHARLPGVDVQDAPTAFPTLS